MKKALSNLWVDNKSKLELLLRKKAIKNIQAECIFRDVEFDDISEKKLEILIQHEAEKLKGKYKTNTIVLLLIALGLHA